MASFYDFNSLRDLLQNLVSNANPSFDAAKLNGVLTALETVVGQINNPGAGTTLDGHGITRVLVEAVADETIRGVLSREEGDAVSVAIVRLVEASNGFHMDSGHSTGDETETSDEVDQLVEAAEEHVRDEDKQNDNGGDSGFPSDPTTHAEGPPGFDPDPDWDKGER